MEDPLQNEGGIPSEAWEWETHDEMFRADLVSEFVHLDKGFMRKIGKTKSEFFEMEKAL